MSIQFEKVSYQYSSGTPFAYDALKDIDLEISEGKITAIIGATGSGKTTLVQHLNALLLPSSGKIKIFDRIIDAQQKPKDLKSLRKEVGLVFQFPEYQLFEETIAKDLCFGPMNFKVTPEDAMLKAKEALKWVDMDESYLDKSPLDLSGGQKRRVAIAGILAMDPAVLVLDEPTAGLDPQGSQQMMNLFVNLNRKQNKTILVVTHDMEHVLRYCDEVVVLNEGKVQCHSTVSEFFKDLNLLKDLNILPPAILRARTMLIENGIPIDSSVLDLPSLVNAIIQEVGK